MTGWCLLVAAAIAAVLPACGAPRMAQRPDTRKGPPRLAPSGTVLIPGAAEKAAGKGLRSPVEGTVASGYGGRRGAWHEGVDLLAQRGTEVRAAEQGIAVYAGDGLRGYGNAVVLDHGDGVTTLYGHLESIRVESGDAVPAGAPIGTVGRSGNATTWHLHFEVRVDGVAVDPMEFIIRP